MWTIALICFSNFNVVGNPSEANGRGSGMLVRSQHLQMHWLEKISRHGELL
jgi:hypothetical protein